MTKGTATFPYGIGDRVTFASGRALGVVVGVTACEFRGYMVAVPIEGVDAYFILREDEVGGLVDPGLALGAGLASSLMLGLEDIESLRPVGNSTVLPAGASTPGWRALMDTASEQLITVQLGESDLPRGAVRLLESVYFPERSE